AINIIIISSLPYGRSLASMPSIYLCLQPFFSFLCYFLLSSHQSCPSLASLLVSSPPFFPPTQALTNCSLAQHVLSNSFSASLLLVQSTSLHPPRPVLLHLSSCLANSPSPFFSTPTSRKRSPYPLPPFFIAYVSQPITAPGHTNVLTILFFKSF